jgi:hypothetical protein
MKKLVIGASVAAMLAVPALAVQQGAVPQGRPAPAPQTRAQVQTIVQQHFAQIDANRDGAVVQAEFDAFLQKKQAERQANRSQRQGERFVQLDANKDGQISRAEFDAGHADHGGRGDRDARRGGHGGGHKGMRGMHGGRRMGPQWFAHFDANKDGRVTLQEALAKPLQRFDQADANKDGTVTPEERKAARGLWARTKAKLG